MQFSDISFWPLFLVFLAIYALLKKSSRVAMLLYVIAFSLLFFYMANGWLMLLLPLASIVTWGLTRVLSRSDKESLRKGLLTLIIVLDLIPLIYYKYTNFFVDVVNQMFATNFSLLSLALPIGISFFTFQAISYSVDVYKGKFTLQVSFVEFLFYLSFFPLLLAGPITRAGHFFPQIVKDREVSSRTLYLGVWLVMLGMLKKCVLADYLAQFNNWVFDDPFTYSGFECLMGLFGYSVQIYCDFSGYSDLSIGIAAMMGFYLRDNFNFPYRSTNIAEFWHRWHISLSTWFRDYFYIPLGGNRKGSFRTYLNNFLTMLLAGLWHGASWMFIIWGAIHGLGLVVNKLSKPLLVKLPKNKWVATGSWLLTMAFVTFAWIFFRSTSVGNAMDLLSRCITDFDIAYLPYFINARPWWCIFLLIPMACMLIGSRRYSRLQTRFICSPWFVKLILFSMAVQLVIQFHTSSVQPFIYYQF